MFTKHELDILEELLNDEIFNYLDSGYSIDDEWIIDIRNLMKKINVKERRNYDNLGSDE